MKEKHNWKKGLFSSTYELFSKNAKVGELKKYFWSETRKGNWKGKEYLFETSGFFSQKTKIIDVAENTEIGQVIYHNLWGSKAVINLYNKKYNWRYNNIWNTRWEVTEEETQKLQFGGSAFKGSVYGENLTEPLILTGLFIANVYQYLYFGALAAIFVTIYL